MKLFIKVRYLGTNYCGYQVQPNAPSIQQKLNEAARTLFGYDCDIVGCSRTDSGVHANEFCATVAQKGCDDLITSLPPERVPLAFSAHLPPDISVFDAKWVPSDFHARYDVLEKEYLYRIYNAPVRDPFWEGRAYHLPRVLDDAALARMRQAAAHLVGKQDFAAYMAQGSTVATTVRTVKSASVERDGDLLVLRISADGFLYNMVRTMVGELMDIALNKRTKDSLLTAYETGDRSLLGKTMPAKGLTLLQVEYGEKTE